MVETGKGWNKGGTKRTMAVADSILGAGKLALEVQQEAGSGGFHHYHGKYRGISRIGSLGVIVFWCDLLHGIMG